jgi:riboflavin biosynthesis pyrimidine reductase
MYEVMRVWEDLDTPDQPPHMREFARLWQAAEKVVYSTTLDAVSTARTRLEREFDPQAVRAMEGRASIGGPHLAEHAIRAGVVDEWHLFVAPAIVGGGTRAVPDGVRLDLELVDERCFDDSGFTYLRYRTRR